MSAAHYTHAIVHTESGMLMGLGTSADAAWADAEAEAQKIHEPFDRDDHEVLVASPGHAWSEHLSGGIVCPIEYER